MSDDGMAWYSARIKEHVLAALAEPGEQLGEGRRERVGVAARHLPAGEYRLTVRDGGFDIEAAPVVPDSAGVRERLTRTVLDSLGWEWEAEPNVPSPEEAIEPTIDAVLAVVGQGVTAEVAFEQGWIAARHHSDTEAPRPAVNPYRPAPSTTTQGADRG